VELRRTLRYNIVTIKADSTGLADENVLGFAFGEKLEKEKFDRTFRKKRAKKSKKSSIVPAASTRRAIAPTAAASAFPARLNSPRTRELSPPPEIPKAHNSSKVIAAVSFTVSKLKGTPTANTVRTFLMDESIVVLVECRKHLLLRLLRLP